MKDGSDHAGAKRKLRRKDSSEKIQWHFRVPVKVQFCYRYVADGKEEKRKYKVYLNGRQEQNLTCEMIPKYCGKIEIQMRKVVCYDALGILGITKRPKEKLFATVMPKVYPVNLIVSN